MSFPLVHALSLSEQIEKFGAYAGLGAVVGLAVLSLLYFSQAREVKRLREWAGRAPERAFELEQRVATDAQRRVGQPTAAPQTVAAQQAARPAVVVPPAAATVAGAQGRPPGPAVPVAAPGAAARIIPASGTQPIRTQVPGPAGAPAPAAGAPAGAPQVPGVAPPPGAAPGIAVPGAPGKPAGAPGAMPGAAPGQPVGAPGAMPGAVPAKAPVPAPTTGGLGAPPASPPSAPPPVPASSNGPSTLPPARPQAVFAPRSSTSAIAQASRFASPPTESVRPAPSAQRSTGRLVTMVAGGVAAVVVVAVLGITLLGGSGEEPESAGNRIADAPAPGTETVPEAADERGQTTPVNRRSTTVAVLNGTTRDGLARSVGNKIEESGFALGTVGNNADQARSATIVSYTPGNRRAAQTVAQIIRVGRDAISPIDRNTAVAAPGARVVVTVGSDRVE